MTDLFNIRRDFTLKTLDESDVLSDPMDMFEQWLNEAIIAAACPVSIVVFTSQLLSSQ